MGLEEQQFENEVRELARQMWPSAQYSGAALEAGHERDGVFITEDNVHLIECTVSRGKDKAIEDSNRLVRFAEKMRMRYTDKAVKCWLVTKEEPTADQRAVVDRHKGLVIILSLYQFRSRLIDAGSYIQCRKNYRYGSMDDSETRSNQFRFVQLDMFSQDNKRYGVADLAEGLLAGKKFVILGDYGAGKSTTLREVFLTLQGKFLQNRISKFPILLNLRDHFGQTNAAEALERHARNIGFPSPSHLVRAWRAGYAVLLLDGFDEVAVAGWSGQASRLRKLRYDSMQLIREFVRDTPSQCGLAISGRNNYFNSIQEMNAALGLAGSYVCLNLSDFNEEQIKEYLQHKGWEQDIPTWLPSRPLLLGYLASRNLLDKTLSNDVKLSPAAGWDSLLSLITEREARIEFGVDGPTLRRLIERLASKARQDWDGLGPLQGHEILKTFQEVCGFSPDDRSIVLLQRLPGLGIPRADDGARSFIDISLADAARAGDVVRYIESPFDFDADAAEDWESTLRELGRQVAAHQCLTRGFGEGQLSTAIHEAATRHHCHVLCADAVQVAQELGCRYSQDRVFIAGVYQPELMIGDNDNDYSRIEYQDCVFQLMEIAPEADEKHLARFVRCTFGEVDGRVSERDMPKGIFADCTFEAFSNAAEANAAILALNLPLGVRVMLVVLKKVHLQSGSGRRDSALHRGLDQRAKGLVPEILQLLQREELIIPTRSSGHLLWLPLRSQSARVRRLLSAPTSSDDKLIKEAAKLT